MALENRRTPPYAPLDRGDFHGRLSPKFLGGIENFRLKVDHAAFFQVKMLGETLSSLKPLNDDFQKFAGSAGQHVYAGRVGGARDDRREDILTAQRDFQTGERDRME